MINPSPQFGTKIRFVSQETFKRDKPIRPSLVRGCPYRIDNRISLKKKGATEEAYNCSSIALHNKEKTTIAHLHPAYLERDKIKIINKLQADIRTLQKESDNQVHALITGGYSHISPFTRESKKLFQLLIETLRLADPSIPIALLWGITNPNLTGYRDEKAGMDLICNAKKDEILLANKYIPPSMENIRKAFRFIHVPKEDELVTESSSKKWFDF